MGGMPGYVPVTNVGPNATYPSASTAAYGAAGAASTSHLVSSHTKGFVLLTD